MLEVGPPVSSTPAATLAAVLLVALALTFPAPADAHRSGCHCWHSCPSGTGSYVCGDLGNSRFCPKKPAVTRKPTPTPQRPRQEAELTAKPVGIDDGDTFVIQLRSQGIDAPEKKQLCENADGACYACGQDAKKALLDMIPTGLEGSIREIPA